jgi:hypothetical protein
MSSLFVILQPLNPQYITLCSIACNIPIQNFAFPATLNRVTWDWQVAGMAGEWGILLAAPTHSSRVDHGFVQYYHSPVKNRIFCSYLGYDNCIVWCAETSALEKLTASIFRVETWCHNSEDHSMKHHHCENLQS